MIRPWRPSIHATSVAISRNDKMLAINCVNNEECGLVTKAVLRVMVKYRDRRRYVRKI